MDQEIPEQVDSGLVCLIMLSRLHGMPADPGQLKHHYGQSETEFTESEILRGAKSIGLKAKAISSSIERLAKTQLPTIAQHKDSHYLGQDNLQGGEGDDTFIHTNDVYYDTYNGGLGNDLLQGTSGDDVFRFTTFSGNNTLETIDGVSGTDTIEGTSSNNNLNFSNTTLTNISEIDGGAGHDTIVGTSGNDTIIGGLGQDNLQGGEGDDTYQFALGDGIDSISDSSGISDNLLFNNISHDQLWFWQSGNDLRIGILNTQDKITIKNWYSDPDTRLETFNTTDDNSALVESNVQQLVDAMATFSAPSSGTLEVPQAIQDDIQSVITTSWQTT